jgi:hypothetical protein
MARRRARPVERVTRRTMLTSTAAALGGSVIARTYGLAESRQAIQDTADRTIVTGVIELS